MHNGKLSSLLTLVTILLVVFGIITVPVLGLGIALGYGLRALIPGLELGWAIVAGAVFATGIAEMMTRSLLAVRTGMRSVAGGDEEEEEEEEDEGEEGPDEPWVTIPRRSVPPAKSGPRRGKKRK